MKKQTVMAVLAMLISCHQALAQINVSTEYVGASDMKDKDGNKTGGRGDMASVRADYSHFISCSADSVGRPTVWTAMVSMKYAWLDNNSAADMCVPDRMVNLSANVIYVCPLKGKWSLTATVGTGIYAHPNHIARRTIHFNGGAIAKFCSSPALELGAGLALSNSYGLPAVLPMLYLRWQSKSSLEFDLSMATGLKFDIRKKWSPKLSSVLKAIDMDGMSAVMKWDGKVQVYSTTMTRSMMEVEYCPARQVALHAGIGCMWRRTSRMTDRKFSNFYKMFSDGNRKTFAPAMAVAVGGSVKL